MSLYRHQSVYWHRGTTVGRAMPNPVVLGRKFCARCGRWRHACDFSPDAKNARSGLSSYCQACVRMQHRERRARRTHEQIERDREYQRFWHEVKRRRAGVEARRSRRSTVVDEPEWVYLPVDPLREVLADVADDEWTTLARKAGVETRTIQRLRFKHAHVRLDVADRLIVARGLTLEMVYRDVPLIRDISHPRVAA